MRTKPGVVNSTCLEAGLLEVLDCSNRPIAALPEKVVHDQGLKHHRAVVLVYRQNEDLLLSMRSAHSLDWPSCWDASVTEHVYLGSSVYETVRRGVFARMGMAFSKLRFVQCLEASPETENEILSIYAVQSQSELSIRGAGHDFMFLERNEIKYMVDNFSRHITSTLRVLWHNGVLRI
jgi:isopentenyldiphosphate isomerase